MAFMIPGWSSPAAKSAPVPSCASWVHSDVLWIERGVLEVQELFPQQQLLFSVSSQIQFGHVWARF